jgi:hypothetical protein
MSGRRVFSNNSDATYNNYYNNRNKPANCIIEKPPITVTQASTSYRYDNERIEKICNKSGYVYPYGRYLNGPPFNLPIDPPIDPLGGQAILEYGVSNISCNSNSVNNMNCLEEEGVNACIGMIEYSCQGANALSHVGIIGDNVCTPKYQLEMELLKTYRFKCYECINPCCPANVVALQMIRDTKSNKSGTVITTMTYGPTGTTTTTTTTVKL